MNHLIISLTLTLLSVNLTLTSASYLPSESSWRWFTSNQGTGFTNEMRIFNVMWYIDQPY